MATVFCDFPAGETPSTTIGSPTVTDVTVRGDQNAIKIVTDSAETYSRIVYTATNNAGMFVSSPFSSDAQRFNLTAWLYVENASAMNNVRFRLFHSSGQNTHYSWVPPSIDGWYLASFFLLADSSGAAAPEDITSIYVEVDMDATESGTVVLDTVWADVHPEKQPIVIMFDDGYSSSITRGMDYLLDNYGYRSSIGPFLTGNGSTEGIGTGGSFADYDELDRVYSQGHDIYVHGDLVLTTLDAEQWEDEIRRQQRHVAARWPRASNCYVARGGNMNDAIRDKAMRAGIDFMRAATSSATSNQTGAQPPISISGFPIATQVAAEYRNVDVNATKAAEGTPFATSAAAMDWHDNNGAPIFLALHAVLESGATTSNINQADMITFFDNEVVPRVTAGTHEVITISEFWERYSGLDQLVSGGAGLNRVIGSFIG